MMTAAALILAGILAIVCGFFSITIRSQRQKITELENKHILLHKSSRKLMDELSKVKSQIRKRDSKGRYLKK